MGLSKRRRETVKPSTKSPEIAAFLDKMAGRSAAIENNVCVNAPYGCGGPATEFRNDESIIEYTISGLCQKCQDGVFIE